MQLLDVVLRNLRFGARSLSRSPGHSLAVIATLALGIGASSAVFTAINAVLFEPLPFPDADRIVRIRQTLEQTGTGANVGPVRLEDWNARSSSFEAMMGYTTQSAADTSADIPESVRVAGVSPRMLEVWGIEPILGRGFVAADHEPGAADVAMIGESLWERRFARDPAVIGRTLGAGDQTAEIVGVMPASFAFPDPSVEVWSATINYPFVLARGNAWYTSFGRLKPGVTVEQAQADLRRVQAGLAAEYPDTDRDIGVALEPLLDMTVGSVRPSLWLLFGAVTALLLIGCTNIAALLLARATNREHDVAVRVALGSSRASVVTQVMTETAILAVLGAAVGLVVARAAVLGFKALAPDFPRAASIGLSGETLVFVVGAVVGVTLLCGIVPALRNANRTDVRRAVEGRRVVLSGRHAAQWSLVGVQVAVSIALLAGAGLFVRSFQALTSVDLGYEAGNVLSFRITGSFAEDFNARLQSVERIIDEVATLPGVESVATSSPVPGMLDDGSGFQYGETNWESIEGVPSDGQSIVAEWRDVSAEYFATMQIPWLAGEPCRRGGTAETTDIVVNESFVASYVGGTQPVGAMIRTDADSRIRIRGVVGDARELGARHAPVPTVYRCLSVIAYPPLAFLVRTGGDPMTFARVVAERIKQVEPGRSMYDVMPLADRVGNEYASDRLRTALTAVFAGAALLLVAVGVYGTLTYIVGLRKREVGLRVALGAMEGTIIGHFLRRALRVVGIACVVGLVIALIASQALSGVLFGVSPADPLTLAVAITLVLSISAIAAFLPAARAARTDPMTVLREE